MNFNINYKKFSESVGFNEFIMVKNTINFEKKIEKFLKTKKSSFMVINTNTGTFKNLLRIKNMEKKKNFFN